MTTPFWYRIRLIYRPFFSYRSNIHMKYKWKYLFADEPLPDIEQLSKELKTPPVITQVLAQRHITDFQSAKTFFNPMLQYLHDPFLMIDMDKAVKRTIKALQDGEHIMIYGDYDVDGVTGTSLLYRALEQLGGKVSFYIPERQKEGYGLSISGIREAAGKDISLIVSVDCGITAIDEVAYANESDIDVIICDHHQPAEHLPDAVAVLDPKRKDSTYPFADLAGCGVAFKFLQGLYERLNVPMHKLVRFLDLVAIGTSADIVPMVDENRIMVKHGLDLINSNPDVGVRALINIAKMKRREITPNTIVFFLAPRINAVGRMGSASHAVHLLISKEASYASRIARHLESENRNRRSIDEHTFLEAQQLVEGQHVDGKLPHGLVLYKNEWHIGVVGIVASRIAEKYHRPTVLMSIHNGIAKGSARSVPGIDIYSALQNCRELLLEFGGHKYAAGVTIKEENLVSFAECFNENIMAENPMVERAALEINARIRLNDIQSEVMRFLQFMKPFGPANMRPLFLAENISVVGNVSVFSEKHVKFKVQQDGFTIDAIFFNGADYLEDIKTGNISNIVFSIEESTWNGTTTVQLRIRDLN
jgi:single-stranded-DNA-specific exonuclease